MLNKRISRRSFLTISAMTAASFALDWKKIAAYAASMGPKSNYPTVIIGAGLGGLCCGTHLSRFGIPVTVVEQHGIPGGYATSFGRGAFTFEVSLHGTSIHNNATARILKDLGVLEQLQLISLPEAFHFKTPILEISVPQRDPGALIQLLTKHFPSEKEGIRGFFQELLDIAEETDKLHQKKGKFFKYIFPIQYRKMWKVRNKTLVDLLNQYVKDPALKDVLAFNWGYYGLPPSKLSGFYYATALGDYLKNGSYYIKPRSQELSNTLAKSIETSGGKILYGNSVEKILVKDGAVQGVAISGGKVLPARAVVSNASALATFKEMLPLDVVPADYLKKLNEYRPSISSFTVWLGLKQELRGRIKGYSIGISSGEGAEANYQYCMKGNVERGPFSVTIYDNLFEGYSKPGKSTLMLLFLTGHEPWRRFEADYRAGRKKDYYKEKARWTDILIRRAEKELIPGLSSMIEVKDSATPLTNWYFTRNPEGAIYGFEQAMNNSYMTRIDNRTPIKGLYLASAWGNPGGGYTGVLRAGELTFQKMMEDWGG
ncbi:MAG: NAD(P)/FAD-dependent oxidoreductase [Thermodesulfobacteriota bacterium]